jgi:hypothetical protein
MFGPPILVWKQCALLFKGPPLFDFRTIAIRRYAQNLGDRHGILPALESEANISGKAHVEMLNIL